MADSHARLSELLEARRLELGMKTWRALAKEADISPETLRALRAGENVAPGTAHAIEKALRWEPGSIGVILEGGEPRIHASSTARMEFKAEARGTGIARQDPPKEDPFDRMDRLYEEWKRDSQRGPVLRELLESWGDRETG